jgi:hypothetical protein
MGRGGVGLPLKGPHGAGAYLPSGPPRYGTARRAESGQAGKESVSPPGIGSTGLGAAPQLG